MNGLFNKYHVLLAPMAGVSDQVMRELCLEFGADLAFTEMVSSKALSYANEKTRHLLDLGKHEQIVAVQLFGHEPQTMAREASWLEEHLQEKLAFVDINMGCPARKIAGKGDGSALMKDPDLAARIVREVKHAVSVPVTCKFRRGFYLGEETAPEFAKCLEEAGACALTVHGRYAQQLYKGVSCIDTIKRVKEQVSIPVVGNGDIVNAESALHMLAYTSCDAIMIARGAQGNPWIFAEIKYALIHKTLKGYKTPSFTERIACAKRHALLLSEHEGNNIVRMRKHACWYLSGLPGASAARNAFNKCVSLNDFNKVFEQLEDQYGKNYDTPSL